MSQFELKSLMSVRSMRPVLRELSVEQIERIQANLSEIKQEHIQFEAEQREKLKEKADKIARIRELMAEDNISADEILGNDPVSELIKPRKRKVVEPKYAYKDADGNEKTWTGQGRTPKIIQEALDSGKTLDDFMIA